MKSLPGLFILMGSLISGSSTFGQTQGLEGHVVRISGNQMPSPDRKPTKPKGIKTTLYIFSLTSLNQVTRDDNSPFYASIKTKLVKKVTSNTNGYFKVSLPPGNYSLFAKKDELFYANWFDGNNHIAPVEVFPQKLTKVEFKIDYDASY